MHSNVLYLFNKLILKLNITFMEIGQNNVNILRMSVPFVKLEKIMLYIFLYKTSEKYDRRGLVLR